MECPCRPDVVFVVGQGEFNQHPRRLIRLIKHPDGSSGGVNADDVIRVELVYSSLALLIFVSP